MKLLAMIRGWSHSDWFLSMVRLRYASYLTNWDALSLTMLHQRSDSPECHLHHTLAAVKDRLQTFHADSSFDPAPVRIDVDPRDQALGSENVGPGTEVPDFAN
jgi:hypothetical protein